MSDSNIEALIPKSCPDYIPRHINKKITDVEIAELAYKTRSSLLMVGPTGSGKTHLVKYIAYKYQKPYIRVSFANGIALEDLLGYYRIINGNTVWEDGILPYAMKNGIIFFADEINFLDSDILAIFNSILDDDRQLVNILHGKEVVKPHPDFWFVAAMNRGIQYMGTKEMNAALIDRFKYYIEFSYPSPSIEEKIVKSRYPSLNPKLIRNVIDIFNKLRNEFSSLNIDFSTRSLLNTCEIAQYMPLDVAFQLTLLSKFNSPSRKETFKLIISKEVSPEFKSSPSKSSKSTNIKEILNDTFDIDNL